MPAHGRILIVEDNEDNRIIYRAILEHSGHTVVEAADGKQGVATAQTECPDVILMDISLPVMDGWEATRLLKSDPRTRGIPIIALTAHALASDQAKAFEAGCDAYLAKPIEPVAVLVEVEKWLEKKDARPSDVSGST